MSNSDTYKFFSLPKAELHCHLDGSVRTSTAYHFAQQKNLSKEKYNLGYSLHEIIECMTIKEPMKDLQEYLDKFSITLKVLNNDLEAIYRVAFEACEDKFADGVRYVEFRYSPHLLCGENEFLNIKVEDKTKLLNIEQVVTTVQQAFCDAEKYLNNKETKGPEFRACQILCGIWGNPSWLQEVIDLGQKIDSEHKFICGVDLACAFPKNDDWSKNEESVEYTKQFTRAKSLGFGVTIHAGECKGADSVEWAIESCAADRIGHGYRVDEDKILYEKYVNKSNTETTRHMEMCPRSSVLTRAQTQEDHVLRVINPKIHNVSLSVDNPGVQLNQLSTEYQVCKDHYGWDFEKFKDANLNGLRAAFDKRVDEDYINKFIKVYSDEEFEII